MKNPLAGRGDAVVVLATVAVLWATWRITTVPDALLDDIGMRPDIGATQELRGIVVLQADDCGPGLQQWLASVSDSAMRTRFAIAGFVIAGQRPEEANERLRAFGYHQKTTRLTRNTSRQLHRLGYRGTPLLLVYSSHAELRLIVPLTIAGSARDEFNRLLRALPL